MALRKKPLESILVKPAGPDCNMACSYCFYLEKNILFPETKVHRMSEDTLEEMVRQVMAQAGKNVSFSWQGGEPTLMGLPFFRRAVELQQRYGRGQVVGNGLQTNGLLIDEEWILFLNEYKFLVGLSLDGLEHVHDHYRLLRSGAGSWAKVVGCTKRMLEAGVAVNALAVVNDYSVRFPEEIYVFLKQLGFTYMQFIPCVETDPKNPSQAAPFSVAGEDYGRFLCALFDLWQDDFAGGRPTTSVRLFDSVFYAYVGQEPPECTLLKRCGVYVVVEHNGDVYSCDFFVEPRWKLGNIKEKRLVDMLNSQRQREFGMKKSVLPGPCRECGWLVNCRGGCPKDRLRDSRDQGLSHFCESYKMLFAHADAQLKALAEDWKRGQASAEEAGWTGRKIHAVKEGTTGRNDPCSCGSGLKYKKCCGT